MDIAEADVHERLKLLLELWNVSEHGESIFNCQVENVGNGVAVEFYCQSLLVVTASVADFTLHVDVGHEVHFDAALTVTLAGFTTATSNVEAEATSLVAAFARFGQHGKEIADR